MPVVASKQKTGPARSNPDPSFSFSVAPTTRNAIYERSLFSNAWKKRADFFQCLETPRLEAATNSGYSAVMLKPIYRKLFYWLPPAGWAIAIFVVSSLSSPPKPPGFPYDDKVAHFLIFAILSMLIYRGLTQDRGVPSSRARWIAFLFASLYGALDEFHQWFVPMRTTEWADWITDTIGAAVVFLTCFAGSEKRKGNRSP